MVFEEKTLRALRVIKASLRFILSFPLSGYDRTVILTPRL
jgi:hypothetical protein